MVLDEGYVNAYEKKVNMKKRDEGKLCCITLFMFPYFIRMAMFSDFSCLNIITSKYNPITNWILEFSLDPINYQKLNLDLFLIIIK